MPGGSYSMDMFRIATNCYLYVLVCDIIGGHSGLEFKQFY